VLVTGNDKEKSMTQVPPASGRRPSEGVPQASQGRSAGIRHGDTMAAHRRRVNAATRAGSAQADRPVVLPIFVADAGSGDGGPDARHMADELRALYDNAPCGYHSIDPTGLITRINETELGWLGYARDEVVGRMHMTDLMSPASRGEFRDQFAKLKQHGRLSDLEYEMQRKDGTAFPVLVNVLAVYDAEGAFAYSKATVVDIGARKRAEIELRESELRNTAIVRAAMDCIVSIDDRGNITEFNPAAENTFGYSREQVLGRDVATTIIPGSMQDAHHQGLRRYLATGEGNFLGRRVEVTAMRRDGTEFPVELAITPVALRDQTTFTAFLRDITEKKHAEQEFLRLADEMQAASRRLVEIQETERRGLANELHDLLGQKLTALAVDLNIVKLESAGSITSQGGTRLQDSLDLVSEIIEGIRNVMVALRPAVLDDYGLAAGLRWYAEQFVTRTGVAAAVIEQGPACRLPAIAEETLFRIAQEALANVAKYADVKEATVTLQHLPRLVRLTIADEGRGFDTSASLRPARDHGWGLMIMKERAAFLGAELTVESAPDRGTQVTVTLCDDGA
jgi:PAS domain S-box-containing protein